MLRPRTPLRILCFGDSLTSGWSSAPDAPYAATLETRLRAAFPSTDIRVEADGVPGALARAFPRRMGRGEWLRFRRDRRALG
jgi:lysophospholipase L1-like esterase